MMRKTILILVMLVLASSVVFADDWSPSDPSTAGTLTATNKGTCATGATAKCTLIGATCTAGSQFNFNNNGQCQYTCHCPTCTGVGQCASLDYKQQCQVAACTNGLCVGTSSSGVCLGEECDKLCVEGKGCQSTCQADQTKLRHTPCCADMPCENDAECEGALGYYLNECTVARCIPDPTTGLNVCDLATKSCGTGNQNCYTCIGGGICQPKTCGQGKVFDPQYAHGCCKDPGVPNNPPVPVNVPLTEHTYVPFPANIENEIGIYVEADGPCALRVANWDSGTGTGTFLGDITGITDPSGGIANFVVPIQQGINSEDMFLMISNTGPNDVLNADVIFYNEEDYEENPEQGPEFSSIGTIIAIVAVAVFLFVVVQRKKK
jgi:hypothetical protein